MNRVRKRFWAVMLAAMLLLGGAAAESGTADGWQFDERGWLTGENPGDAYLREDAEEGIWEYSTADLSIRVKRYRDTKTVKKVSKIIEYCIAEVYASETNPLFSIMTPASKKKPAGYNKLKPEKLVAQNPVMLAMSDDYYGHRMQTKANGSASWPIGIIIRNGETLATTTRNSTKKRYFPPLDTLAVYGDGSMKTFVCDELKVEEYEEQGATQVFAFGPWLIRNGEINEAEAGPDSKYYAYNDPRAAIGMIEPFHYILITVKGEPKSKYSGVHMSWVAEKLKELGCVEALNLDGGGTACMIFNGKTIICGRNEVRPLGSMIAFGKISE